MGLCNRELLLWKYVLNWWQGPCWPACAADCHVFTVSCLEVTLWDWMEAAGRWFQGERLRESDRCVMLPKQRVMLNLPILAEMGFFPQSNEPCSAVTEAWWWDWEHSLTHVPNKAPVGMGMGIGVMPLHSSAPTFGWFSRGGPGSRRGIRTCAGDGIYGFFTRDSTGQAKRVQNLA